MTAVPGTVPAPPAAFTEWCRLELPLADPAAAWSIRQEQHPFWVKVQAALDAKPAAR